MDEFTMILDEFLEQLNMIKYEVYILGDMNIDVLKHHTHTCKQVDTLTYFAPIICYHG